MSAPAESAKDKISKVVIRETKDLDEKSRAEEVKATSEFTRAQIEALREQGPRLSGVLKRAYQLHDHFNDATTKVVKAKLEQITKLAKQEDLEKVHSEILQKGKRALLHFKHLTAGINYAIAQLNNPRYKDKPDENPFKWARKFSFPVKTHKMVEVLEGAIEFLQVPQNFYDLCDGKIHPKFDCTSSRMTVLGEELDGKGNSRATYLKAVIALVLKFFHENRNQSDLDSSPMAHAWALPSELDLSKPFVEQYELPSAEKAALLEEATQLETPLAAFEECDFMYKHGPLQGIETIHSYFAFGGGHFKDPISPDGKPNAPIDCTKGITIVNEYEGAVTTADQVYETRLRLRGFAAKSQDESRQRAIKAWENGAPERKILKECELVTRFVEVEGQYITDLDKVQPGDTGFECEFFDNDPDMVGDRRKGHAWIVASHVNKSNGKFLGFNWGRDMPSAKDRALGKGGFEGAGVSDFTAVTRKGAIQGFFRPKKA